MEGIMPILAWGWAVVGVVVPFLFVLGVVVFVHEYGHFIVGRLCGAGVKVFSLGMGKELVGLTDRYGTRWRLSAIPLGGYVKFAGDKNAMSAPDAAALAAMTEAERRASLAGQPLLRRAAIVVAGPVANFLLGIIIFAGLAYTLGETTLAPRIGKIAPDSPAERAGFQKGDVVESIDGEPIYSFADIFRIVSIRAGEMLTIVVERDGRALTLQAAPALKAVDTMVGPQRWGVLGFGASDDPGAFSTTFPSFPRALGIGASQSWSIVTRTVEYLTRVVMGRSSADQFSGTIQIARLSGAAASIGFSALLNLTAIISVSLGLVNLLPVPMLDGGHLLFYGIEAARGEPLSRGAQEFGLRIGLAMVLMLVIFVTVNDIWRLVSS
jgi:regulator of sigma E protease